MTLAITQFERNSRCESWPKPKDVFQRDPQYRSVIQFAEGIHWESRCASPEMGSTPGDRCPR